MLKKILIAMGALLLLVVVGLVALVALVDVDHYKPQIETMVHDRTDRTLKIDGRLSLSVFPTIALALPRTTLSEHRSDQPFLSLDHARVSLAVLPLLSGRVEAGTVSLYGLRATIDRRADGSSNLDDLTGGPKPAAAPQAPSGAHAGAAPVFQIGGIELVDAQLIVRDEKAHSTLTISKLNLKTGRLANRSTAPIDFSATIDSTEPKAHVELSLKAKADVDLDKKAFGVQGLEAHVRGQVADDKLDVALTAPALELDAEHASGDSLKLVAAVTGAHQARAEVALDKITGNGEKISAARMALDLDAEQGPQKVSAKIASPLQVGVAAQSIELSKLDGEVNLQSPSLPQKALKVSLDGSLRVDAKTQNVGAKLKAHFDDTNLESRLAVQGFSSPHIAFDVEMNQLNLDRYLPPAPAATGGVKPAAAAPTAASAEDPKVDLSALKPLNLTGELRIGSLQAHNLKATKLKVGVRAASGHLDVAPMFASLYEGALNGTVKVDAGMNRVAANVALDGISIQPLLKDLMGKDILDGHGNVKLDVATQGPTVGAMKRALGGTASLALKDGAVRGINIAQKLREIKSTLAGAPPQAQAADASQKTDFSEMTASFKIVNGVASNNDLVAKSPLLRLNGAGNIDIGASSMDYTAQVSVVGTLAGQGGGELSSLKGMTIPVHLKGPFTALSYQLDWGALANQALKAKAADKVKDLLGDKLKQGGQSDKNLGDALKGLLGK